MCLIFLYISIRFLSLNRWHVLFRIKNNRHDVTITTHAIKRHFLIWMTTMRQPMKRRCSCVLTLKYTFICVSWWTRQRIHNTLIVVDRYLRLMGDKTIPDSAEPRLESFYPPFIAGIDLPHQGVVDSYNPPFVAGIDLPHQGVVEHGNPHTWERRSVYWDGAQVKTVWLSSSRTSIYPQSQWHACPCTDSPMPAGTRPNRYLPVYPSPDPPFPTLTSLYRHVHIWPGTNLVSRHWPDHPGAYPPIPACTHPTQYLPACPDTDPPFLALTRLFRNVRIRPGTNPPVPDPTFPLLTRLSRHVRVRPGTNPPFPSLTRLSRHVCVRPGTDPPFPAFTHLSRHVPAWPGTYPPVPAPPSGSRPSSPDRCPSLRSGPSAATPSHHGSNPVRDSLYSSAAKFKKACHPSGHYPHFFPGAYLLKGAHA